LKTFGPEKEYVTEYGEKPLIEGFLKPKGGRKKQLCKKNTIL
jgi:hypothetical protein